MMGRAGVQSASCAPVGWTKARRVPTASSVSWRRADLATAVFLEQRCIHPATGRGRVSFRLGPTCEAAASPIGDLYPPTFAADSQHHLIVRTHALDQASVGARACAQCHE